MKKITVFFLISIICLALFAAFPLFGPSYIPTHDGEYHIIRFMEFFRVMKSGVLFPRWAPTLNSGYGIPIFQYHYPLPNYIGAVFQFLGFQAVDAFKYTLAVGYIGAGIFCFLWLKRIFGRFPAFVGTAIMLFTPYWFVDIYIRGSVGEVLGIMFLFFILTAIEYKWLPLIALGVSGLLLSHNILAMVFFPFIIIYTFLRYRKAYVSVFLGMCLSAFFIIPAIIEQKFVVGLNTVNFREHFAMLYEFIIPSWGSGFSGDSLAGGKVSFQIGLIPLLVLFIGIWFLFRERQKERIRFIFAFIGAFFLSLFFAHASSKIIWEYMPFLSLAQYPWRFLSFVIPITGLLSAYITYRMKRKTIPLIIVCLALLCVYQYMRPVLYQRRDDAYYSSRQNFTDGTSSMGESFSTIWSGWKKDRSPYKVSVANGKITDGVKEYGYLLKRLKVSSDEDSEVRIPILYFPGWKVETKNGNVPIAYMRDGTIQFSLPKGEHDITIHFTETPVRAISDMISIISLGIFIGWVVFYKKKNNV